MLRIPADCCFDHLAQQVPDVGAAVAWYRQTFVDCRVLYQDETWAFVEVAGAKLAFIRQGDHPDHIGWRVSQQQLDEVAAACGQSIRTHRDQTRSIYLPAPGDRWIELIAYPPEYPAPASS